LPDLDGGESFLPDFDTFLRVFDTFLRFFDTFFPDLAGGSESFLPEFDLPRFILEKIMSLVVPRNGVHQKRAFH
jgi:hypothetical protein